MSHEDLTATVEALLFADDPLGISAETNPRECRPEAGDIVQRLPDAATIDDLQRIVHETFVHWFSLEAAGPVELYRGVTEGIWAAWLADRHRADPASS